MKLKIETRLRDERFDSVKGTIGVCDVEAEGVPSIFQTFRSVATVAGPTGRQPPNGYGLCTRKKEGRRKDRERENTDFAQ